MRKFVGVAGVAAAACLLSLAAPQRASAVRLSRVASFNAPIFITAPPTARPGTLFVVQRDGVVTRYYRGERHTFANIAGRVSCCSGERGLLSMAFDPNWKANRRVYFAYTNNDGDVVVARYRANAAGSNV